LLVEDLDDADRAAEVVLHRHGEDRSRAIPRREIELGVETWVAVRIVDEERLARLGDVPRDSLSYPQTNLADLIPLDDPGDELALPIVEEIERRPIGFDRAVDLLEDELEELVEIERRPEGETHLTQRDADPLLTGELLVEVFAACALSSRLRWDLRVNL